MANCRLPTAIGLSGSCCTLKPRTTSKLDLDAYHAIRDTSKSFAHLGAVGDGEYALEGEDGTVEAIRVGLVTPRSFQFLPAVPMHRPRAHRSRTARPAPSRLCWFARVSGAGDSAPARRLSVSRFSSRG